MQHERIIACLVTFLSIVQYIKHCFSLVDYRFPQNWAEYAARDPGSALLLIYCTRASKGPVPRQRSSALGANTENGVQCDLFHGLEGQGAHQPQLPRRCLARPGRQVRLADCDVKEVDRFVLSPHLITGLRDNYCGSAVLASLLAYFAGLRKLCRRPSQQSCGRFSLWTASVTFIPR